MKYTIPAIEEYEKLLPVARRIYEHNSHLSWQLLLPLFLLSVLFAYTSDLGLSGAVVVKLKKLILVALLLVAFPMIAEFCQSLGVEVARSIDDMTGIDYVLQAASKRAEAYSFDLEGILNLGSDIVMGALVLISFLILVVARFFLIAFQHFYWFVLVAIGPFLILCALFESSVGVTKSLFKSMIQVSCWPIIWAILSAFLKALPFGTAYTNDTGLVTVVTLNLIIAVALLFSPFLISQLSEGVTLSVGDSLKKGVMKVVEASPKGYAASRTVAATTYNHTKNLKDKFKRS